MDDDSIEKLMNGDVDFLDDFSALSRTILAGQIRRSPNANEIIRSFISLIIDKLPYFCFNLIYDNAEFDNELRYLLNYYIKYNDIEEFEFRGMLFNTPAGKDYALDNMELLCKDENMLNIIFEFIFRDMDKNMDLVKLFYLHSDLHIRYLFMKYIVEHHPELINVIYDDFMKYLTSYTFLEGEQLMIEPELMAEADISDLAVAVLKSPLDRDIWAKLKTYILEKYRENSLARNLLEPEADYKEDNSFTFVNSPELVDEFKQDADRLFLTSSNYRFTIFTDYVGTLSKDVRKKYEEFIKCFYRKERPYNLQYDIEMVYEHYLGSKLESYVDKYLGLSKSKVTRFIGSGTCACCYQIGDFAFKLLLHKWSREEEVCPNSYLIVKNYEADYVRDKWGVIRAGIEVQPYLHRGMDAVPFAVLDFWKAELAKQGYYCMDMLVKKGKVENCRLLNSYLDADCDDPGSLPDTFKEYPVVLIDRDLVFKLGYTPTYVRVSGGYYSGY